MPDFAYINDVFSFLLVLYSVALKLFQAGHSLYCRAPTSLESKLVPNLLSSCKFGINTKFCENDKYSRGEIETFYSSPGHVTDDHTDFQENFTIQLQGVKKWTFSQSSLTHPLRGCAPHFSAAGLEDVVEQQLKVHKLTNPRFRADEFRQKEESSATSKGKSKKRQREEETVGSNINNSSNADNECSVILHPGDVLYHPAGIWHRVECLDSTVDAISGNINDVDGKNDEKNKKTKTKRKLTLAEGNTGYSIAINVSLAATTPMQY